MTWRVFEETRLSAKQKIGDDARKYLKSMEVNCGVVERRALELNFQLASVLEVTQERSRVKGEHRPRGAPERPPSKTGAQDHHAPVHHTIGRQIQDRHARQRSLIFGTGS